MLKAMTTRTEQHSRRRRAQWRGLRTLVALSTLAVSSAAPVQSSNMGLKHIFGFPSSGQALHWIALPLQYAGTDAEALCTDLPGTGSVWRWDEATSTLVGHACGDPSPFALVQGTGYAVVNAAGEDIDGALVGSHIDDFVYSLPATSGSNLNWTSIPYHLRLPNLVGPPIGNDAEDLCRSVGESEIFAVVNWDEDLGVYTAHACGSELVEPFVLERGSALGLVNASGQAIDWQAPVWLEEE